MKTVTIPKSNIALLRLQYIPGQKATITMDFASPSGGQFNGTLGVQTTNEVALNVVDDFFTTKVIPWLEARGIVIEQGLG